MLFRSAADLNRRDAAIAHAQRAGGKEIREDELTVVEDKGVGHAPIEAGAGCNGKRGLAARPGASFLRRKILSPFGEVRPQVSRRFVRGSESLHEVVEAGSVEPARTPPVGVGEVGILQMSLREAGEVE